MASLSDRADLIAANGLSVTIGSIASYAHDAANDLLMQSFSSQGPSDVDFRVKPDVVAPGGNVLSSIPGNDWAFYSGTSMSSPHLAGMAAVVLGQHPTWTAAEIRSAIVNTANPAVVKNSTNPLVIGNGAADLFKAVAAKVALDPVSTSFGAIPVLNGHTSTRTIAFKWLDGSGAPTVTVIGSDAFGASYANGVITVTYTPRETGYGPQHAVLKVSDGTSIVATSRLFAWGK
jgi:subtilisin family serine protease